MNIKTTTLPKLKFKGVWRKYQQRVLNELDAYLDDKKLNVVAAPGAGKTTLGIEVIRRLGKPVLILAPTVTIRNQWVDRIKEAFLVDIEDIKNISTSSEEIKPITILTYQLLHSIVKNQEKYENFLREIEQQNIKVITLDEAHHLITEWHNSLIKLCDNISKNDITTLSLTGTPPYDVPPKEWENYHNLCGPVDAEISIPELVKNGDLCPHQDLIWFSKMDDTGIDAVQNFKRNRDEFFDYINKNADLLYAIKTSPFADKTYGNMEIMYEDFDFTVSVISYLLSCDELDTDAYTLIEFLAIKKEDIPTFNYEIAETLFNGILGVYEKYFKNIPTLKGKLKELNLLETAKKVDFTGNTKLRKYLMNNSVKLSALSGITQNEYSAMRENLREVILLDYIGESGKTGVNIISTFEIISKQIKKTGILSGSLVVIPQSAKEKLYAIIDDMCLDKTKILTNEYCPEFLRVESYGDVNLTRIITDLFASGEINVLIGTQSLLGEGWDSPCVNTLVIASIVGSFMLSNQMRGRAIRIDKSNHNKISNIWHLVTLQDGFNQDLEIIKRRFSTFEGISFTDNTIRNNFGRLGYSTTLISNSNCNELNKLSIARTINRNCVKNMWQQVFTQSAITESNMSPQVYSVVKTEQPKLPALCVNEQENWFFRNIINPIIMKYNLNRNKKDFHRLANSVLRGLCTAEIIKTPFSQIEIKDFVSDKNESYFTITNCSNYEREVYINILSDLLKPATNNRYILRRYDSKKKKEQYIAVPDIVATNKKQVKIFAEHLMEYFGYLNIIFTRNPHGRRELLIARYNPVVDKNIKTDRIWI